MRYRNENSYFYCNMQNDMIAKAFEKSTQGQFEYYRTANRNVWITKDVIVKCAYFKRCMAGKARLLQVDFLKDFTICNIFLDFKPRYQPFGMGSEKDWVNKGFWEGQVRETAVIQVS